MSLARIDKVCQGLKLEGMLIYFGELLVMSIISLKMLGLEIM